MGKRALITGITGQDGSYLAELLLAKKYEVYGLVRHTSTFNLERIAHLKNIEILEADITDFHSVLGAICDSDPDEVYNLAAQSYVPTSWIQPKYTFKVNAIGTLNILEAMRCHEKDIRFYQASSSEMFGNSPAPQSEMTPFNPISPYAISKMAAHDITKMYRNAFGMHCSCGICFNHESPRRGTEFVTKKITATVAAIKDGTMDKLRLGNLEAKRDWGYAGDYVKAMWMMLQQDKPDDYIIATGEMHSVKEFVEVAFDYVGLDWEKYVEVDEDFKRPNEVNRLCGDARKIQSVLGWTPKVKFDELVTLMVESELMQ
jgi:GDPmannose 4,6-dehydratase